MKIFIVTSGATYSTKDLSYAYVEAFETLGHEVLTYPLEEVYQPLRELCRIEACLESNVEANKTQGLFDTHQDTAKHFAASPIVANVVLNRPDLVVFIHGINVPDEILHAVSLLGVKTALVLADEPQEVDLSKQYSHLVNYVFTNEKHTVEIHQKNEQKHKAFCNDDLYRVNYLPTAAYTHALDRAEAAYEQNNQRYDSDIIFIGSMYPERYSFLNSIKDVFLENSENIVVGPGNPQGDKMLGLGEQRINQKFEYKEYAKYVWGCNVFLDKSRNENVTYPYGGQNSEGIVATNLSPRIYEALYCRCIVVTDSTRSCVNDFSLKVRKAIEIYSSVGEIRTMLPKLKYPALELNTLAPEIRNEIFEEHSYLARAKTILDVIGG